MDKYIIVNLNMFSLSSFVFIISNDGESTLCGSYDLDQLPEAVNTVAHENDVYNVRIASSGKFAEGLVHDIEVAEMSKYNERKLKVEVI